MEPYVADIIWRKFSGTRTETQSAESDQPVKGDDTDPMHQIRDDGSHVYRYSNGVIYVWSPDGTTVTEFPENYDCARETTYPEGRKVLLYRRGHAKEMTVEADGTRIVSYTDGQTATFTPE